MVGKQVFVPDDVSLRKSNWYPGTIGEPRMSWQKFHSDLRDVLAGLFCVSEDARRIAQDAGLPLAHIAFSPKAVNNWQHILEAAIHRGKVPDLVAAARKDFPENPCLRLAEEGRLDPIPVPERDRDLDWRDQQDSDAIEKIMGQESTFLPIWFLERGLETAKSVCLIDIPGVGSGTGFLVGGNAVVTNNHVLPDRDRAADAKLVFNRQQTLYGLDAEKDEFHLRPEDGFWTSCDDDYTIVRVAGNPNGKWGAVDAAGGKVKKGDRVCIIQHPGGGDKQIAFHHNKVMYVDDRVVQYLTDTMPGSSGAPVFDEQWKLVAVHHSGGWIRQPGTKRIYFRNEGIALPALRKGFEAAGVISIEAREHS